MSLPFLMKFARDISVSAADQDNEITNNESQPPHNRPSNTIVTKVNRETTDDS